MKRFFAIIALGMLMTGGLLGCEASASIDDDDRDDTSYRRTTTVEPDGDRTTRTEIRRD